MLVAATSLLAIALPLSDAASRPSPSSGPTRVAAAGAPASADDARARYLEGDFARAVDIADEVIGAFEHGPAFRTPVDDDAWDRWADAQVVRALALRRLDRDADADAALRLLLAVRPDWVPDAGLVPPKVLARIDQLREAQRGQAPGTLRVTTSEAGAQVFVDGRALGAAPVSIELPAGVHFVGLADAPTGRRQLVMSGGVADVALIRPAARTAPATPPPASSSTSGAPSTSTSEQGGVAAEEVRSDGNPWLWIGIGTGAAVVTAAIVTGVIIAVRAPSNPGGIDVRVDTSNL